MHRGRTQEVVEPRAQGAPFRVGRWLVEPSTDSLTLDGGMFKLEPRTMRLLVVLASRPGEVISSEELLNVVWPSVVVTGQSLYQAVGELRAALKTDSTTAEFIATVPRKGYRLVAAVASLADAAAAPAVPTSTSVRDAGHSIAVLPFRDLGLRADMAFLRETLLAGLILELSRQPNLVPIARGTMLSYASRALTPRQVAAELGVRYVLDGTIAHGGAELQIACELVEAASDGVLASEALQLDPAQWPELTQRIVGRLARAARLQLTEHAAGTAAARDTHNVSALELAMRAWVELYCRPQTRETNDRAWQWAAEALRRDDALGAAWNSLAFCEWRAAQYDWSDHGWAPLLAESVAHAQRATTLSPADPDGYYTLGLANFTCGEFERAEGNLRHCLEISASYAPAYGILGVVRAARGHPEESAEWCRRAFALSPREPLRVVWYWVEACSASMLGRDDEALERACLGIAANPDFPACHLVAAVSAWRLGRSQDAARHVAALRRSAFHSMARVRERNVLATRVQPWGAAFLADLHAAGLP